MNRNRHRPLQGIHFHFAFCDVFFVLVLEFRVFAFFKFFLYLHAGEPKHILVRIRVILKEMNHEKLQL